MEKFASFRDVIGLWTSLRAMAGEIGVGVAAARKWWQRNSIPAEWWQAILDSETAKSKGVTADLLASLAARETSTADTGLEATA